MHGGDPEQTMIAHHLTALNIQYSNDEISIPDDTVPQISRIFSPQVMWETLGNEIPGKDKALLDLNEGQKANILHCVKR